MTPEQIKARLETLEKYEWTFNQYLRSGEYRGGNLGELQDINENHYAIFGSYESLSCNHCRGNMMRAVAEWYFENKSKYINA
jgi:hypothetical protein